MSVISGTIQAIAGNDASRHAANVQADAATTAAQAQMQMFNQQYNDPFNVAAREQGTAALGQLGANTLAGQYGKQFSMGDFQASPAYQSMLGANQLLLQNAPAQYSASGMLGSGNMQSGLQQSAQLNAMQSEPQAYSQWAAQNVTGLNALQSLSGLGQTQTNALGGLGQNAAYNAGQFNTQAGAAQASGAIGQANALNQGIAGAWNQGMGAYNLYSRNQMWNQMMGQANNPYSYLGNDTEAYAGQGYNMGGAGGYEQLGEMIW